MAELSHAHNQHAQFNTAQPHAAALHAAPYDMAADATMCPAPCSAPAPQQHGDKTAAFGADTTFACATPNQPPQAQQPQQPQNPQQPQQPQDDTAERLRVAIGQTAPGTSLRFALDMILAGHMGALICIGDTENVLAAGDDGFTLDISFTANRLFELSKMDGAIVIDKSLTKILRANYHLNPSASLPTSETGMRHRTAARMSLLTRATVISVSERRQVVALYVNGRGHQLLSVPELMSSVNQLLVSMQSTRAQLDRSLLRLTTLELDDYVTLADIVDTIYLFEVLISVSEQLEDIIIQLGSEGRTVEMQREEFIGNASQEYTLLIRDYAKDSSEENATRIRAVMHDTANTKLRSAKRVAELLGFENKTEDSIMVPLGLRTLSNVSVVRKGMADKIVDEFGSLQQLLDDIEQNPSRLDNLGVDNPSILANSLYRMWGKRA
ncbi:hypothetical protein HMPREF9248_1178 [Fannyhessea vaginae PB189-T1-4]|uniref:DAC domain-containing protein n=1 Tax=Fannyhessea vaginae PB189-T1-4 TaxID=866774 RepID=A0ABN0B181_9ACTN|nr:DNA integrity scanning diadenylate cyclase DisA [Fannyhessea vaginae]EFL44553.1 hypothetical protein HMPREF9248_1178 [Fannyhessea vaginae PB189-T1-4]